MVLDALDPERDAEALEGFAQRLQAASQTDLVSGLLNTARSVLGV